MSEFWAWDYTGAPFQLFGPAHIAALLALVLMGYGLLQFKNSSEVTRRNVRIALGIFLWVNEAAWHFWKRVLGALGHSNDAAIERVQHFDLAGRLHAHLQELYDL